MAPYKSNMLKEGAQATALYKLGKLCCYYPFNLRLTKGGRTKASGQNTHERSTFLPSVELNLERTIASSRQGMRRYALEILSSDAKAGGSEQVFPQRSKTFGEIDSPAFLAQARRVEMLDDGIAASSAAAS